MKTTIPFILLVFLVVSCKKSNDNNNQISSVSGKFSFSMLNNLKSASANQTSDSTSFVLDTVKSSRSFYFILGNSGQNNITDVNITSNNANFNVTPTNIQILPGSNSTNNSTVTQVIALDVIHGTRINGVGYTGLLPMGNNTCLISITGQTSNGKDTVKLRYIAKIQVFAQVMNVTLSENGQEFNLNNPPMHVIGIPEVDEAPMFNYGPTGNVYLKNTGNVPIVFSIIELTINDPVIQSSVLSTNDSVLLNVLSIQSAGLQLNSQGTIFDQSKFAMGSNGEAYIGLENLGTIKFPIDTTHTDTTQNLKIKRIK